MPATLREYFPMSIKYSRKSSLIITAKTDREVRRQAQMVSFTISASSTPKSFGRKGEMNQTTPMKITATTKVIFKA